MTCSGRLSPWRTASTVLRVHRCDSSMTECVASRATRHSFAAGARASTAAAIAESEGSSHGCQLTARRARAAGMPVFHAYRPTTVAAFLRMAGTRSPLADRTRACPGERERHVVHMTDRPMLLASERVRTISQRRKMSTTVPTSVLDARRRMLIARRRAARRTRAHFVGTENLVRLVRTRRPMRRTEKTPRSIRASEVRRAVYLLIDGAHRAMDRAHRPLAARALHHLIPARPPRSARPRSTPCTRDTDASPHAATRLTSSPRASRRRCARRSRTPPGTTYTPGARPRHTLPRALCSAHADRTHTCARARRTPAQHRHDTRRDRGRGRTLRCTPSTRIRTRRRRRGFPCRRRASEATLAHAGHGIAHAPRPLSAR